MTTSLAAVIEKRITDKLDTSFRDFSGVTEAWFPPDEFDSGESRQLVALCKEVERNGYRTIAEKSREEAGRNVLDLLSDHLPFLGDSAGKSILGIAVASEMYTHPFASENFASGLARCPTFIRRPSAEKPHVAGLFHLARFVRGLDGSAKLDALRFMEDRAFPSSDQEPKKFPMSEAEQTSSPPTCNRVQSKP